MLILLLFNYFEAQWWPTSKIKFSCVSSCHVCVRFYLLLPCSFDDHLSFSCMNKQHWWCAYSTNICKNVRKTRVFKKGERISCGHQHSHRHNTTPLYFVQNFYCRRSRFLPFKIIYRSSSNSQGNKRCNNERISSMIFVDILLIQLFKKLKKLSVFLIDLDINNISHHLNDLTNVTMK